MTKEDSRLIQNNEIFELMLNFVTTKCRENAGITIKGTLAEIQKKLLLSLRKAKPGITFEEAGKLARKIILELLKK